jgi:hypothetical protein
MRKKIVNNSYFNSFALAFIIFITNPVYTLSQQTTVDIRFSIVSFFISIIIYLATGFLILSAVSYISNKLLNPRFTERVLLFACIYVALCTINPVTMSKIISMNGIDTSISMFSLATNMIISAGIYYLIWASNTLTNIFFACTFVFTTFFGAQATVLLTPNSKQFQVKLAKRNLVVISFDGIPGISMNEYLKNSDNLASLKDFTLYKNSISHSPATYASIHQEIFGSYDWKKIAETENDLREWKNTITGTVDEWYLDKAQIYGSYAEFATRKNNNPVASNSFAVTGKEFPKILLPLPVISTSLCKIGICTLGPVYGNFGNYIVKILDITGFTPNTGAGLEFDYLAWKQILRDIKTTEDKQSAFFAHFIFSHFPIRHDENCKFYTTLPPQNSLQISKQIECIEKQMVKLIEIMKRKNVYENSLIVFKSDHGKPSTYYPEESLRGAKIADQIWGYDRYRPFVMIKFPKQSHATLNIVSDLFYLSDLSKIYCSFITKDRSSISKNCSFMNEIEKKFGGNDTDKFLYVANTESGFMFDQLKSVKNEKNIPNMENMFKSWAP